MKVVRNIFNIVLERSTKFPTDKTLATIENTEKENFKLRSVRSEKRTEVKDPKEKEKKEKNKGLDFNFNLIEVIFSTVFPFCSWSNLKKKKSLLEKAKKKMFFQLDVLNYLKNMQLLDLLIYSVLEPSENTILQFLAKPSISLAQKKDIHDAIQSTKNIDEREIEDLHSAIKFIFDIKEKTPLQKRLLKLTKIEMGALMRKIKISNGLSNS